MTRNSAMVAPTTLHAVVFELMVTAVLYKPGIDPRDISVWKSDLGICNVMTHDINLLSAKSTQCEAWDEPQLLSFLGGPKKSAALTVMILWCRIGRVSVVLPKSRQWRNLMYL